MIDKSVESFIIKSKLSFDVCRCNGINCDVKDECLRHTDVVTDKWARVSYTNTMNHSNLAQCPSQIKNIVVSSMKIEGE